MNHCGLVDYCQKGLWSIFDPNSVSCTFVQNRNGSIFDQTGICLIFGRN